MLSLRFKISAALILAFGFYAHCEPVRFFEGDIQFFEMERGCSDCPPGTAVKPGAEQAPIPQAQAEGRQKPASGRNLICFITLDSPYTERAVSAMAAFKTAHPEVNVRGVVLLPIEGAEELIRENTHIWETGLPFDIDFCLREAKAYKITEAPSFVFEGPDRAYKIAGQPDLTEIYSTAFPLDKNL